MDVNPALSLSGCVCLKEETCNWCLSAPIRLDELWDHLVKISRDRQGAMKRERAGEGTFANAFRQLKENDTGVGLLIDRLSAKFYPLNPLIARCDISIFGMNSPKNLTLRKEPHLKLQTMYNYQIHYT